MYRLYYVQYIVSDTVLAIPLQYLQNSIPILFQLSESRFQQGVASIALGATFCVLVLNVAFRTWTL